MLAEPVPLGWVILIAVLAPAASLLGAWWGARREGKRRLYADQTARNAAFQESKRQAYSSLVASIRTLRRGEEPATERLAEYDEALEDALGYAKDRTPQILGRLGEDVRGRDPDIDTFRKWLFDDPGLR